MKLAMVLNYVMTRVLLTLVDGEKHGYAMAKEVEDRCPSAAALSDMFRRHALVMRAFR